MLLKIFYSFSQALRRLRPFRRFGSGLCAEHWLHDLISGQEFYLSGLLADEAHVHAHDSGSFEC